MSEIKDFFSWTDITSSDYVPGSVLFVPVEIYQMHTQYPGWLECVGQQVSRTSYSSLYSAIGTRYGNGNGSTTFHIPDYRGLFFRGRDNGGGYDPDWNSRTVNGWAHHSTVGSIQDQQIKSHSHTFRLDNNVNYNDGWADYNSKYYYNRNIGYTGGVETRPRNYSVTVIIRYS